MSAPAPSMFTPAAKAMAEKLGLKMGRANLEEFAATLEELAKANPNIIAVTSDSRGSGKLAPFGKVLPKQIVEVGIAEQNLVGITAGLAACGKKAFGVSPGCFLTARSLEQIKNDVCYSDVPAVLVGISSGVSYGALGTTVSPRSSRVRCDLVLGYEICRVRPVIGVVSELAVNERVIHAVPALRRGLVSDTVRIRAFCKDWDLETVELVRHAQLRVLNPA